MFHMLMSIFYYSETKWSVNNAQGQGFDYWTSKYA